jgi:hypothetical protein
VAVVVAALNNADRSRIGNPRRGTYAVSLVTEEPSEARQYAKRLASLGLKVQTNVYRDENGEPLRFFVTLYGASDQKRLFELTESQLRPERRQRFEDLVLARGPIPDNILKTIRIRTEQGLKPGQIANRMNEKGVIAGMGGVRWTAKKVRFALAEQHRRARQRADAA